MEQAREKIRRVLEADKDTSKRTHEKLFEVSPKIAEKIKAVTGINVSGYQHAIDKSEVNHAINRHSNSKTAEDRSQLPIASDDILSIPEIVESPASLSGLGKDKLGREAIAFEKNVGNGKTFVYEAAPAGKKEPAFQTMFKKKTGELMPQTVRGIEILRSFFEGKTGLLGSVANPNIGRINIYSGSPGTAAKQHKDGHGLEHIVARRWVEGNNVAETLFGINEALAQGEVVRDYGGDNGRVDLQQGDYIAVVSKQRFGEKEQWALTGFKVKSGAEGESCNPTGYAPYSSGSRSKVGADFEAKVQQKVEAAKKIGKEDKN